MPKPHRRSPTPAADPSATPTAPSKAAAKAPGRTPAAWANKGPGRPYDCKSKYIDKTVPMRGRKAKVESCATPSREAPRVGRFRVTYSTGGHANVPKPAVHRAAYRASHPKPPIDRACPPWKKGCGAALPAAPPIASVDSRRAALRLLATEVGAHPVFSGHDARAKALRKALHDVSIELIREDGPLTEARFSALQTELGRIMGHAPPVAYRREVDAMRAVEREAIHRVQRSKILGSDKPQARVLREALSALAAVVDASDGPFAPGQYADVDARLTELRHRVLMLGQGTPVKSPLPSWPETAAKPARAPAPPAKASPAPSRGKAPAAPVKAPPRPDVRRFGEKAHPVLARASEFLGMPMPPIGLDFEGMARWGARMMEVRDERDCFRQPADLRHRLDCRPEPRQVVVARIPGSPARAEIMQEVQRGRWSFDDDGTARHTTPPHGKVTKFNRERVIFYKTHIEALNAMASDLRLDRVAAPLLGAPEPEPRRLAPGHDAPTWAVDEDTAKGLRRMLAGGKPKGYRATLIADATHQTLRVLATRSSAYQGPDLQLDVTVRAAVKRPGEVVLDMVNLLDASKGRFELLPSAPDGMFMLRGGGDDAKQAPHGGKYPAHARGGKFKGPEPMAAGGAALWTLDPVAIGQLERVLPTASDDETRPHLASVFCDGEKGLLVTTDGHRLSLVPTARFKGRLLLPKGAIEWMLAVRRTTGWKGPVELVVTQRAHSNLLFRVGGARIHFAMTDREYPSYEQVIPSEMTGDVVLDRAATIATIERVLKDKSHVTARAAGMKFDLVKNRMTTYNPDTESGTDNPLPVVARHESYDLPKAIGFNAIYVVDALRLFDEPQVTMKLSGELDPALFTTASGRKAVIMPMRV